MHNQVSQMYVIKRNGEKEKVMFDKITLRISKLIDESETQFLDPMMIAQKVINSIYSGVTTEELDLESAKICSNITINPLYNKLAGRILASNLHKKTLNTFVEKMEQIQSDCSLLDEDWLNWIIINRESINNMMDYSRDYTFDFFGFKTLERSYLLKNHNTNQYYERPQDVFMRVASFINMGDLEKVKITYDLLSTKAYTHASPTLFNAGTKRPQLSSCFLLNTNDSLEGITKTWDRVAQISKWAGGIGLHVSNVRSKNSIIRGTNGVSSGIIPMLQVYNNIARYINQAGKRKGSFAIYLENHHADIEDFLELRKNTGAETERARDLFLALWVSDLFMEQVEKDGDWYLMCPDECPNLNEVYGKEYEELYWSYVNQKKYRKIIKARKLMEKIMDSQLETGTPYILYKDHANEKSNQKNIGIIKSSNLCVDYDTHIITNEGIFKIGDLENKNINIWNGSEFSKVDIKKTNTNQIMNKIIFSNGEELVCTPEHKFYIQTKYTHSAHNKTAHSKNWMKEIRAKDLKENMKIIKFEFPIIDNKNEEFNYPYTHGLFCADGTYYLEKDEIKQCNYNKFENNDFCKKHLFMKNYSKNNDLIINKDICNGIVGIKRPLLFLYGKKQKLEKYINIRDDCNKRINTKINRTDFSLPIDLPEKYIVPYNHSLNIKLRWLEGFVDGDGCITNNNGTQTMQMSSINLDFLKDIKKLINTLGIDCKINIMNLKNQRLLPDGQGGIALFECQTSYRLIISAYNLQKLVKLGFNPKRLVINDRQCNREAGTFIKVKEIIENYKIGDTYCFTEPIKHTGVFNGILTGQCSEILLVSNDEEHAVCNLASICLNKFLKPFRSEKKWTIYTKPNCKYCKWAKNYFEFRNFEYEEKELNKSDTENRNYLIKHLNNNSNSSSNNNCEEGACSYQKITYPQIFYGDTYIGGFDDMIQYTADDYDYNKLWETAYIATINLDHVVDINYYPTPETKCSNLRNRPLGLGIQGLADTLVSMKIPYESEMALRFNRNMMETIYHASLTASMNMAHARHDDIKYFIECYHDKNYLNIINIPEYYDKNVRLDNDKLNQIYHEHKINKCEMKLTSHFGAYSSYLSNGGSPMSKGLLQFDLWKEEGSVCNWDNLRDGINEYGVRNSLLVALMPTASTSQIMGNNECFEWFTNNIYTRRTLAGDFPLVNKHLVFDLLAIGEWNENIKQTIIATDGNISDSNLFNIPASYKELYKTIWDIKQLWVLKHARARAPFVDQTQSMNIFMGTPDYNKLLNCHMWAWKNGLKTGMYYLRSKPSEGAMKVTVDPNLQKQIDKSKDLSACESCSA